MARTDKKKMLKQWVLRISVDPHYKSRRHILDLHALHDLYLNTYQEYKSVYGEDYILLNIKSFSRIIDSTIISSEVIQFNNLKRTRKRTANVKEVTYTILSDEEVVSDIRTIPNRTRMAN